MPAKIKKKGGKFEVRTPGGVKAKGTTKDKAKAQQRLLNAIDRGFQPTGLAGVAERAKMKRGKKRG